MDEAKWIKHSIQLL